MRLTDQQAAALTAALGLPTDAGPDAVVAAAAARRTTPAVSPAPPRQHTPDVEHALRMIRDELGSREAFACPGCVPGLSAQFTAEHYRIVVDHTSGCTEAARWLLHGVDLEPPPGTTSTQSEFTDRPEGPTP